MQQVFNEKAKPTETEVQYQAHCRVHGVVVLPHNCNTKINPSIFRGI